MTVIPELSVQDPTGARRLLVDVFGFHLQDQGQVQLNDQMFRIVPRAASGPASGHGAVDHIAISVPDLSEAMALFLSRGAQADVAVTPDGPQTIGEFWGAGVRYLFLRGPEGARIEVIQNLGSPHGPGHDHIGLPCTDIAASVAFAQTLGARLVSSVCLSRPEGATEVRFMALGGTMLEFYQTKDPAARPAGLWSRLLIPGAQAQSGPDGLMIGPA